MIKIRLFQGIASVICLYIVVLGLPSYVALLSGIGIALIFGNPYAELSKKLSPKVMSYSLIALGAGMNLIVVAKVGLAGFTTTFGTIGLTLLFGLTVARLLRSDLETSTLITVGTAICGGSAIASVAPAIGARSNSVSIALGVVFLLNALALLIFPPIGHFLGFTEDQFGLWAALAIHDTSSVVGASMAYGPKALAVGTTVKLARALWIIPLTFLVAHFYHRHRAKGGERPLATKKPWFILGFLLMAAFFTYAPDWFPALLSVKPWVETLGRRGLLLSLFLIGLNINVASLKSVGPRPVALGVILWILVSTLTAAGIWGGVL